MVFLGLDAMHAQSFDLIFIPRECACVVVVASLCVSAMSQSGGMKSVSQDSSVKTPVRPMKLPRFRQRVCGLATLVCVPVVSMKLGAFK